MKTTEWIQGKIVPSHRDGGVTWRTASRSSFRVQTKIGPSNSAGTVPPRPTRTSRPSPKLWSILPTLPPPTITAGTQPALAITLEALTLTLVRRTEGNTVVKGETLAAVAIAVEPWASRSRALSGRFPKIRSHSFPFFLSGSHCYRVWIRIRKHWEITCHSLHFSDFTCRFTLILFYVYHFLNSFLLFNLMMFYIFFNKVKVTRLLLIFFLHYLFWILKYGVFILYFNYRNLF